MCRLVPPALLLPATHPTDCRTPPLPAHAQIQKSELSKGEAQYAIRAKELQALKRRVAELSAELRESRAQVASIDELKAEVVRLERELLAERTKIKVRASRTTATPRVPGDEAGGPTARTLRRSAERRTAWASPSRRR